MDAPAKLAGLPPMRKSLLLLLAAPLLIALFACSAPGEVDFSQYEKSIFIPVR
jgi:hypothetical protein